VKDDQLQAVADQIGRAIEAEEANAAELMRLTDQSTESPVADHLRTVAREHRVHGIALQGRLAAVISAIRGTRGQ